MLQKNLFFWKRLRAVNEIMYCMPHLQFSPMHLQSKRQLELNEKVKDILRTSRDYLDNVSASKLNADYDYADTSKKKYRYQAVFDFTYLED